MENRNQLSVIYRHPFNDRQHHGIYKPPDHQYRKWSHYCKSTFISTFPVSPLFVWWQFYSIRWTSHTGHTLKPSDFVLYLLSRVILEKLHRFSQLESWNVFLISETLEKKGNGETRHDERLQMLNVGNSHMFVSLTCEYFITYGYFFIVRFFLWVLISSFQISHDLYNFPHNETHHSFHYSGLPTYEV